MEGESSASEVALGVANGNRLDGGAAKGDGMSSGVVLRVAIIIIIIIIINKG